MARIRAKALATALTVFALPALIQGAAADPKPGPTALAPGSGNASGPKIFSRPDTARLAAPDAVDHVVTMEIGDSSKPAEVHRVIVTRSGGWLKEEDGAFTSIADLHGGSSFSYGRLHDRYEGLSISGPSRAIAFTLQKTRETHRALGEICTIWRFEGRRNGDPFVEKNCLTRDNILVWQRVESDRGYLMSSARAISIVRRPVKPAEVRLPGDLMLVSTWTKGIPGTTTDLLPNDDVSLASDGLSAMRPGMPDLMIRRLGPYRVTRQLTGMGQIWRYFDGSVDIFYEENGDGSLRRLEMRRTEKPVYDLPFKGRPIRPTTKRTILGHDCALWDSAPDLNDFGQIDCLTPDGMVLERLENHGGAQSDLVATRAVQGKLAARDMAPPAEMLDPVSWGVRD